MWAWFVRILRLSTSRRCSAKGLSLSASSGKAAAKCTFPKETRCRFFLLIRSVESVKLGCVRKMYLNAWPVREAVLYVSICPVPCLLFLSNKACFFPYSELNILLVPWNWATAWFPQFPSFQASPVLTVGLMLGTSGLWKHTGKCYGETRPLVLSSFLGGPLLPIRQLICFFSRVLNIGKFLYGLFNDQGLCFILTPLLCI